MRIRDAMREEPLAAPAHRQVERSVRSRVGTPTKGARMFADEDQITVHTDHDGEKYLVVGGKDGALFRIQLTRI